MFFKKFEITKITVIKYLTYFDVERRFFKSKEHVSPRLSGDLCLIFEEKRLIRKLPAF